MAEFVEKKGTKILRERDEWGYTPAHWAALDGNVELMRFIIDKSAPIDLPCLGTQGPRPIHWACRKGKCYNIFCNTSELNKVSTRIHHS